MEPRAAAVPGPSLGVKAEPGGTPDPGLGLWLWSWNVNGIRGSRFSHKLEENQRHNQPRIICLQETRVSRDSLDEPTAITEGYNSYFSFCKTRSGYSGVATFCQDSATPFAVEEGLSGILSHWTGEVGCYGKIQKEFSEQELRMLDSEGRALITQHRIISRDEKEAVLSVINVYCPRADPDRDDRKLYKLRFCQLLQARAEALLQAGGHVVVLGDMNTSHRPIDQSDPMLEGFDDNPCRQWLRGFLVGGVEVGGAAKGSLFVDAFRHLHPGLSGAFTCWRNSTAARKTNFGSRIDYVLVSQGLAEAGLVACDLEAEIHGSDHCPVRAVLACGVLASPHRPVLCTARWPEFAGRQLSLSRFLVPIRQTTGSESLGPVRKRRATAQPSLLPFLRSIATGGEKYLAGTSKGREGGGLSGGLVLPQAQGEPQSQEQPQAAIWRLLLPGPPRAPLCRGHQEPCVLRTVKKAGPQRGRQFYTCGRPQGATSDPRSQCRTFLWVSGRVKGEGGSAT
uniref:DNA-(apurinic or apyrimidinic site) endonuclease n=1 Tax=Callorhinchus milii TaxID=7868 RepID=A0A4W3J9J5_CALMI|eukprot:gi/632978735/ref/XP_007906081.1/ PREDICTED: DNA-(apurinic or apyrimidinic site) lyase 2 isoform X1 [Callorhinchus milii]